MNGKKTENLDLTRGGIASNLIRFSLPLIATNLLQLLYNAADVAVVGRFAGAEALAAVGSTTALVALFTMMFVGISMGANVVIAQTKGEGKLDRISRAVHTAVALALVSGLLVMILGVCFSRSMLRWMDTPDDVIDLSALYLTIVFLGAPVNMVYNFGAAILRAMGDTRRPLFYLAVSGAVNVALNLLLVIACRMGVAGVAIATVVSQGLSAAFVTVHLVRAKDCTRLKISRLRLDMEYVKPIVRIGIPSGIQLSVFSLSNVIIQSAINANGAIVMAGNAAAANFENFVHMGMTAFASAILTFSSTNRGARLYHRVRKGFWVTLGIVTAIGVSTGAVAMLFGEQFLSLYNPDPEVIAWGMVRMRIAVPAYFLCGMMEAASSQLRALRYSVAPMAVGIAGACGFRILWIYTVFAAYPTMEVLYLSYPISWLLTTAAHLTIYFLVVLPRLKREEEAAAVSAG